eukprot:4292595-Pleurochrysis_carterae.AAC.4
MRPRVCLSLKRAERVATRARAFEAMRRSMHALRVAVRSRSGGTGATTLGWLASHGATRSFGVVFVGAGTFASVLASETGLLASGSERGHACECACLASVSEASVR